MFQCNHCAHYNLTIPCVVLKYKIAKLFREYWPCPELLRANSLIDARVQLNSFLHKKGGDKQHHYNFYCIQIATIMLILQQWKTYQNTIEHVYISKQSKTRIMPWKSLMNLKKYYTLGILHYSCDNYFI